MEPNLTRRHMLVGIGSGIAGATGAALFSQSTKAASVKANFGVANKNKDVSTPVQRVDLTATGTYEYNTSVIPDSVILRLEAKRGTEYQQLAATKIDNNLTKTYSDTFELTGNLLDLGSVGHGDVNPVDVGQSKNLTLDARILMSVRNNGNTIHKKTTSDSFHIQINKTTAQVSSTINATGNVSVVTE